MHGWLKLAEADVEGTVDLGSEGEFDIGLTRSSGSSRQRHSWAAVTDDAIPMDAYERMLEEGPHLWTYSFKTLIRAPPRPSDLV